jgi:hypothetical protein
MAKDAGNSFSNALDVGRLTRRRNFSDSLNRTDRFDYYEFRLAGRSALTSSINRLTDDADLTLYDSNRKRIAFSSKPGRQNESLTAIVDEGSYYVRVNRKSGSPSYRLSLSIATPPDQAGNTLATARLITPGATSTLLKDAVGTADTADLYRFENRTFSTLGVNLSGLSADANIQVLNSNGNVIRSSIAADTTPESINAGLAAGTYYVRVVPGANSATTNYELSLTLNPLKFVGLANNTLVSFNAGNSNNATSVNITGLAAGERLLGLDFRPATGQLFGLGSSNRLYTLNAVTGAATQVGTSTVGTLSGTSFGFDFNPVPDRIRVVSNTEQNLRLNPDTGGLAGTDTALTPAGNVVASAYTNNRAGATATTLYGIDSTSNQLVRQGGINGTPSPNGGVLTNVGALGVDFLSDTGFDIFTDSAGVDFGFAVSGSTLYSINLTTGAATNVGSIGTGSTTIALTGLAVRG